jgi:hypothetical protein
VLRIDSEIAEAISRALFLSHLAISKILEKFGRELKISWRV